MDSGGRIGLHAAGGLTRATGEDVGTYGISQGGLTAGGNYTIDFSGTDFAISPATSMQSRLVATRTSAM